MPGDVTAVTVTVDYMTQPTIAGGTWLPFAPTAACVADVEIIDGRSKAATGATVPGTIRVRWDIETVAALYQFDALREGLPFRVNFTHATAGTVRFTGWLDSPPDEDYRRRTVTVSATDGIGRLQRWGFADYVDAALRDRGDVDYYWPLDDFGGVDGYTARPLIGGVAGSWHQSVLPFETNPLRPSLISAVQLADIGNPDTGRQSADFSFAIDNDVSHCIACSFKLTDVSGTATHPIAGFVDDPDAFISGPADIETIGLDATGATVRVIVNGSTVLASFTAVQDRIYSAAVSWSATFTGSGYAYVARAHVIDEFGAAVVNQVSGSGTAVSYSGAWLTVGPVEGVVQDLIVQAPGQWGNTDCIAMTRILRGYANHTVGTQWQIVSALTDVPMDTPAGATSTIEDPITNLSSVASWMRQAETTEAGAVYWRDGLLRFKDDDTLTAQASAATFANDGTGVPYEPENRTWTPVYNRVIVSGPSGQETMIDDDASIALYGVNTLAVNALTDNYNHQSQVAFKLAQRYAWPRRHFPALTTRYAGDTTPVWDVGLFDKITVKWPDGSTTTPHIVGRRVRYTAGVDLAAELSVADLSNASVLQAPTLSAGAPVVSGSPVAGSPLSVTTTGTWAGTADIVTSTWWQYSLDGGSTWDTFTGVGPATGITIPQGQDWSGRYVRALIVAVNPAGSGFYATPAVGPVVSVPAQVGNVTVDNNIATPGSFLIEWDLPYNGGSALTQITVQVSQDAVTFDPLVATQIGGGGTTSAVEYSHTAGALYYVRVAAHNAQGRGRFSEAVPVYASGTSAGPITIALTGTAAVALTGTGALSRTRKLTGTAAVAITADADTAAGTAALTGSVAVAVGATGVVSSGTANSLLINSIDSLLINSIDSLLLGLVGETFTQLGGATASVTVATSGAITRDRALTGTADVTVNATGSLTTSAISSNIVTEAAEALITEVGDNIVWETVDPPASPLPQQGAFTQNVDTRYLGNPFMMTGVGNIPMDYTTSKGHVAFRFVASTTSSVSDVVWYSVYAPGYGAGNYGRLKVALQADNGSYEPDGVDIASYTMASNMNVEGPAIGNSIAAIFRRGFNVGTPNVVEGNAYWVVFTNVASNPTVDHHSINCMNRWTNNGTSGDNPDELDFSYGTDRGWRTSTTDNGYNGALGADEWSQIAGGTSGSGRILDYWPLTQITYADGTKQGTFWDYTADGITVSTTTWARMVDTVKTGQGGGTVDSIHVRGHYGSGATPTQANIQGRVRNLTAGTDIVPWTSLTLDGWWHIASGLSGTLPADGTSISIEVRATSGTFFMRGADRDSTHEWDNRPTPTFDGEASTNSGSTWSSTLPSSAEEDYPIYCRTTAP